MTSCAGRSQSFSNCFPTRGRSLGRLSDLELQEGELQEGEPPTRDEQVALESTMVVNVLHKYVILMYVSDPQLVLSDTVRFVSGKGRVTAI